MVVVSFNDKDASIKLTKNEIYSIMNGLKYEDAHVFTVKNNELIDQFEDLFIKITQKKS